MKQQAGLEDLTSEGWDTLMAVDLKAAWLCTKAALELAGAGIRVDAVCPGYVRTPPMVASLHAVLYSATLRNYIVAVGLAWNQRTSSRTAAVVVLTSLSSSARSSNVAR
jgi:NAD(P)-dependent dehydrogenase (short-subunit alcohol dehydrogenase family)